jgi:hypothetical protein
MLHGIPVAWWRASALPSAALTNLVRGIGFHVGDLASQLRSFDGLIHAGRGNIMETGQGRALKNLMILDAHKYSI